MRSKNKQHRFSSGYILIIPIVVFLIFLTATLAFFTDSEAINIFSGTTPRRAIIYTVINNQIVETNSGIILEQQNASNPTVNISNFNEIKFTNNSSFSVYVRAKITCNWDPFSGSIEDDCFDCLAFELSKDNNENKLWFSTVDDPDNDNDVLINGQWVYFKTAVDPYQTFGFLSGIKVSSNMPSNAKLTVFVEGVQANESGRRAFFSTQQDEPTGWAPQQ